MWERRKRNRESDDMNVLDVIFFIFYGGSNTHTHKVECGELSGKDMGGTKEIHQFITNQLRNICIRIYYIFE
jgi:hypothetical protein